MAALSNKRPQAKGPQATDLTKWRLTSVDGRQAWTYDEANEFGSDQTLIERHALGLDTEDMVPDFPPPNSPLESLRNAMDFYSKLQVEDGHWPGDFSGPTFLLPGLLIVYHLTKSPLPKESKLEMIRYTRNIQADDGGWGMHIQGKSTVFGTVLNYVALRLLGVHKNDPGLAKARGFLHSQGGAVSVPTWGKFWLSVLGVYEWDGCNAILPELWLLPTWSLGHPSTLNCLSRQANLGMAYCYAVRVRGEVDQLVKELREELYVEPYHEINWPSQRNNVASVDLYTPHSWVFDAAASAFNLYEKFHNAKWRQKAVAECLRHVQADDKFSNGLSVGAVSMVINMLVQWHAFGSESEVFKQKLDSAKDFLWMGIDGMKMQCTDGSQTCDTSLSIQAMLASGAANLPEFHRCLNNAHKFLKLSQISENPPDYKKFYRQMCKGGFSFGTKDCGWMAPDATAEALKSILLLQEQCKFLDDEIPDENLYQAVDMLLNMRNRDGGFSGYETKRGPMFLEILNPSELFAKVMIDYTYVEITSQVLQFLNCFHWRYPKYRAEEIRSTISNGIAYIRSMQKIDGSWEGSWGVCYTYGTWHALEALALDGKFCDREVTDEAVRKACAFLCSIQRHDGGWGEAFESCAERKYIEAKVSDVVNTAYAILALMAVRYTDVTVLERGVQFIVSEQLPNGDWPQGPLQGVTNRTCAVLYTNFKSIFPMLALGRFRKLHPDSKLFD